MVGDMANDKVGKVTLRVVRFDDFDLDPILAPFFEESKMDEISLFVLLTGSGRMSF